VIVAAGFTIGEVLNQLKEDFEDITISKIRFLESEGLVFPDRTDSGYRKFSDDDVNRLRFILTAQRDHYLPLKVIRDQLDRLDAGEIPNAPTTDIASPLRMAEVTQALDAALATGADDLLEPDDGIALTVDELADATGLTTTEIRSLREYGLIGDDTGATTFGAADLLVSRAARELLHMGLESRHLRMYLQFVDREVSLFEQIVTPLLRQRNPAARRRAGAQLEQLATMTGRLKQALLVSALRQIVHGG
jgi:DNA-binding transcriptional MerR regulator